MFAKVAVIAACFFGFAQAGALAGYGAGLGGYSAGLNYGGHGSLGYAGSPATSYVHRVDYNTGYGGYRAGYGAGYGSYGAGYGGYGAGYSSYGAGYSGW